ncbi:uncharacterized protein [Primulina huaijiensis]|uniref:uncharacterized protein n=1 Tax=Primulina huaijiensis TaxID=1492673 RepID=UPI003CC789CA
MGHTAQKCPLSSDKGKFQGKIFTMTKEGANPDSSVISGNILISGKEALTLTDTGGTHSFMSEVFMLSLSCEPTIMPLQFTIMLPSGDEICPTSILTACPVQMGTRLLYADFIVIPMVAFDVILGMDWLSAYRAVIDCVGKTVKFVIDDHENNAIVGLGSSISTPIISCLQAIKLLNKGCTSFLALVSDVNRDSNVPLQNIEVVQEYPDVFADDVPGLPPDREEHQLDLQLLELKNKSDLTGVSEFGLNSTGLLTFRGRICVPVGDDIRKDVLIEAHSAPYSVKIEHQRPAGTLLSLPIPQWKWEHITIDFVTGLPRTPKGYNSIWVIVDRLTKSAHFLPVKTTFTMNQYAEVYVAEIIGDRAYRLALPPDLDRMHNVFPVSMLCKYLPIPSHVLRHESLDLLPNLSYEEMPVQVLDRKVKVLRNKEIGLVKVLWRNQVIEEATWEPEEEIKHCYPSLFDGK